MAKGRNPDLPAVQQAKGNPGKRHIAPDAENLDPVSTVGNPWVITPGGAEVYKRMAPTLAALAFLKSTDDMAVARYCENLNLWVKSTKAIEVDGLTITSKSRHGELLRKNPAFEARDKIERRLEHAETALGLTPTDRYRIMRELSQNAGLGRADAPAPAQDQQERQANTPDTLFRSELPRNLN